MSKKKKSSQTVSAPIPEGFIRHMAAQIGEEEADALAASLSQSPSVSVRINRKKVADIREFANRFSEYGVSPVPWCSSGFYLDERPDFTHDPLFHAGTYYVQEAASMVYETIVESIMNSISSGTQNSSPVRVLDLCAAPGGKSTAILNTLDGKYILVSNEVDAKRARVLKENLEKWGDPNVVITNSPSHKFAGLKEIFDIVAVDAPCSGEGMMRRESIARTQWSASLVEQCSLLQRQILDEALPALRPGGFLIYSTCTFNNKENEDNVEWLVNTGKLSLVESPRHFYPHRDRCEGLFVAVFKKKEEDGFIRRNLDFNGVLSLLKARQIKIIGAGIEKVVKKGNLEIPSSKQVLAYDYNRTAFPMVEIEGWQAVEFLRKNSITLPEGTPEGFVAVSFKGYPLGLVKNIGKRANNLYPSEWRILT